MSRNKLWNVNEKKRYKMYKDGKQWLFAGIGLVTGLLGAGSTNTVSTAEKRVITKNFKNEDAVLATKTSAVIPKSEMKDSTAVSPNSKEGSASTSQTCANNSAKANTTKNSKVDSKDISQTDSKSKVLNSNSENSDSKSSSLEKKIIQIVLKLNIKIL